MRFVRVDKSELDRAETEPILYESSAFQGTAEAALAAGFTEEEWRTCVVRQLTADFRWHGITFRKGARVLWHVRKVLIEAPGG